MTYQLNKTQARSHARSQLNIFDEVNTIMRKVIVASDAGDYSVTVDDGTTMTESTPTSTITGTQSNPTITGTPTLIIAGVTITLGTSGTNLNAVVADINDAGVTGLVASKDAGNNLVLSYTHPQQASWSVAIGSGTANADLGLTAGAVTATNPTSVDYYNAWQGQTTDRSKEDQMKQVIDYFENLGYVIERRTNTNTNKTFSWNIKY